MLTNSRITSNTDLSVELGQATVVYLTLYDPGEGVRPVQLHY